MSLGFERRIEPSEEVIESVAEFCEFVGRAAEGQTLVQAGGGDPLCRAGDGSDGSKHPAGNEPASQEGEHGHDG